MDIHLGVCLRLRSRARRGRVTCGLARYIACSMTVWITQYSFATTVLVASEASIFTRGPRARTARNKHEQIVLDTPYMGRIFTCTHFFKRSLRVQA